MGKEYTFFQLPAFIPKCLCSVFLCKPVCVFPSVVLQIPSWISPSCSCEVALQLTSVEGSPASNVVQDKAMSAHYLHSRSLGILLFFFFSFILYVLHEASLESSLKTQKALWMLWLTWVCIGWLHYLWISESCSKAIRIVFPSNMVSISAFTGFSLGHKKEHTSAGIALQPVA